MNYEIIYKSLTIRERTIYLDRIKDIDRSNFSDLLSIWVRNNGESSENYFKRRLSNSKIKEENLPYLICPILKFDFHGFKIPNWYRDYIKFLKGGNSLKYSFDEEIPFNEISLHLSNYFISKFTFPEDLYSPHFEKIFKRQISIEFSELISQSLLEYFYSKNTSYIKFIEEFNFGDFFKTYPYLTRLIFTKGNFIYNNFRILFNAISKDFHNIRNMFSESQNFKFCNISFSGSDTHNFGKSVIILEDNNKQKIVFKYRNGSIDIKFNKILKNIIKENNLELSYTDLKILSRNNYLFMEFFPNIGCENSIEVSEYFQKIGIILFMFYIFETTDIHDENLVATKNNPILVDLETLFSGEILLNRPFINKLSEELEKTYGFSVLRAGLLPNFSEDSDGNVRNISALSDGTFQSHYIKIKWHNIGKDDIYFNYDLEPEPRNKNLVYLNNNIIDPFNFSNEIKKSFELFYKKYLNNPDSFLKHIKILRNEKFRFIFRPTRVYSSLLLYLQHPDFMKDGILRSLEIEKLASPIVEDLDKKYIFWDIFEDELKQMENLDVPYYFSKLKDTKIYSEYGLAVDGYLNSALNRIYYKIRNLNNDDLSLQLDLINNSFNRIENELPPILNSNFPDFSIKDLHEILDKLFCKLNDNSVTIDGRSSWIGNRTNTSGTNIQFSPIGNDTANGNMGVACFLAAYYKLTSRKEVLDLLNRVILPVEDIINNKWSLNQYARVIGIGGTVGLGSLIYSLVKVYEFTQNKKYLDLAEKCIFDLEFDVLKYDFKFDITSGLSGFILSLIKLNSYLNSEKIKKLIKDLATRLISLGFEEDKFINWNYQLDKKILGFSHGSSGGLFTLSKIYNLLDNFDSNKINSILDYEQSYYKLEHNNWPDFRDVEENFNTVSWCHGGVGIGFARLQLLRDGYKNSLIYQNIDNIITKMISKNLEYTDTVCCGLGGWVDFLIELEKIKFPDERISNFKKVVIKKLLFNYSLLDNFYYGKKLNPRLINPGFYQGISGIGYVLIREIDPDTYKSILLFE